MTGAKVRLGAVRAVHPAKREAVVGLRKGRAPYCEGLTWAEFELRGGECLRCKCDRIDARGDEAVFHFVPGVTRDNVARLKGAAVFVEAGAAHERAPLEFDADDIDGMTVVDEDGQPVGRVAGVVETPAHPVLEIESTAGGSILLPAIDETIAGIDANTGRVTVRNMAPYMVHDEGDDSGALA